MAFKVKFWGVRGTIACPGPKHTIFGGNTSCVEVSMGGEKVIFDAGTGIRNLGNWMLKKGAHEATILMSHTHWDHINGFPFFKPAFDAQCNFKIMAGHLGDAHTSNGHESEGRTIQGVLGEQMTAPYFPVPIDIMLAQFSFQDFTAGDDFDLSDKIHVRTAPLNHPGGATAYRLEFDGKSLCYVTDTEHVPGKPDENILGLIKDADMVIYDCSYDDAEFDAKVGWGHSTWQEGIRLCKAANVKQLAIFHHDPDHEDEKMEEIECRAREMWEHAFVARENVRLVL